MTITAAGLGGDRPRTRRAPALARRRRLGPAQQAAAAGTSRQHMSWFGDDLWHLHPAHPDAHATTSPIRWARFPLRLRQAFKAFFFAALD